MRTFRNIVTSSLLQNLIMLVIGLILFVWFGGQLLLFFGVKLTAVVTAGEAVGLILAVVFGAGLCIGAFARQFDW
jgi:hypothetical protein